MRSTDGWSFRAVELLVNRRVLQEGERIVLSSTVVNTGAKIGTVYVRFLVADSYRLHSPVFDSDRDLSENERRALRLVDIEVGENRRVACDWTVPPGSCFRSFDIRAEVWNPHRLFDGLWWTPLSRPFFARNKLISGGVLGLSFGGGFATPPRAIPALESALGSHPCGALSSVPVPSV
jgi:hypothetical protein